MCGGGSGSHSKDFISDNHIFIVVITIIYYCYVEVDEFEQFASRMWTVVPFGMSMKCKSSYVIIIKKLTVSLMIY